MCFGLWFVDFEDSVFFAERADEPPCRDSERSEKLPERSAASAWQFNVHPSKISNPSLSAKTRLRSAGCGAGIITHRICLRNTRKESASICVHLRGKKSLAAPGT
jgi:hypothetical protein